MPRTTLRAVAGGVKLFGGHYDMPSRSISYRDYIDRVHCTTYLVDESEKRAMQAMGSF